MNEFLECHAASVTCIVGYATFRIIRWLCSFQEQVKKRIRVAFLDGCDPLRKNTLVSTYDFTTYTVWIYDVDVRILSVSSDNKVRILLQSFTRADMNLREVRDSYIVLHKHLQYVHGKTSATAIHRVYVLRVPLWSDIDYFTFQLGT